MMGSSGKKPRKKKDPSEKAAVRNVATEHARLKDLVVQAVQKHVHRSLTKEDIVYSMSTENEIHTCTVTVKEVNVTVTGQPAPTEKESEEMANRALCEDP